MIKFTILQLALLCSYQLNQYNKGENTKDVLVGAYETVLEVIGTDAPLSFYLMIVLDIINGNFDEMVKDGVMQSNDPAFEKMLQRRRLGTLSDTKLLEQVYSDMMALVYHLSNGDTQMVADEADDVAAIIELITQKECS